MHSYALRLFTAGRAGMLLEGSWVLPEVRASRVDYGVAPIPRSPEAPQDPRPLTIVYAVSASALTAHPDEAIDFLNYLASPESVVAMHDVLDKAPVRQDVLRLPALRQDRELKTWRDQAANGVALPNLAELDYVWAPWARALDEAIPGLRPAQDALDQAVEQIRSYIESD
jgi:arabinogalactan oligomer/maltooligosaccharide transport system substrate-binding protein